MDSTHLAGRRVVVAMSGGVDSSVAAALLKKQGCEVQGVFMDLGHPDTRRHATHARAVADYLGVSLAILDAREIFRREVLDYFAASYAGGLTPNPCVVCNRKIKSGLLLEHAESQGADFLATGHYARIVERQGKYHLLRGKDQGKDQSYFLSMLTQERLARMCFPLGALAKEEVYGLARQLGLEGRHSSESQDVCFLSGQKLSKYLTTAAGFSDEPGAIVTLSGREVGRHQGVFRYTIGQRRGLGVPDTTPYYVLFLDTKNNRVVVGKEDDLYASTLAVGSVNWIAGMPPPLPDTFTVRIRHRHPGGMATVEPGPSDTFTVRFSNKQRAITPGQFAVFYLEDEVVGGGEILVPAMLYGSLPERKA